MFKLLTPSVPTQNISKSVSKKFDVFGSKFGLDTFPFVD
jgi:hypothetical protein